MSMEFEDPDQVADAVVALNPTSIPGFTGELRITVDPIATKIEEYLDE